MTGGKMRHVNVMVFMAQPYNQSWKEKGKGKSKILTHDSG
jgi:hypothetical protein